MSDRKLDSLHEKAERVLQSLGQYAEYQVGDEEEVGKIAQALRDVQRETAQGCIDIIDDHLSCGVSNSAAIKILKVIRERFLKEKP